MCGLAGCAGGESGADAPATVEGDGACVDGFRVVEEAARVSSGRGSEVRLRFVNGSDVPLAYDARVVFERATWIGNTVENGRVALGGSLGPGESAVETATVEGDGPRSTDYEVTASVVCES